MTDLQKQQDRLNSKRMLKHATSFVFAIIVFGLSVEFCVRVEQYFRFGAPIFGEYRIGILRVHDKNIPNTQFEKWKNNNLGFRGPDITVKKPEGKIRVVCMGASETYGVFESPDKEWPAQLRDLLPSQYEVVNTAVAGLTLNYFPSYIAKHVLPIEPDVVVIMFNPVFMIARNDGQPAEVVENIKNSEPEKLKNNLKPPITNRLRPTFRVIANAKQIIKQALVGKFPTLLKKFQIWNLSRQITKLEAEYLKGMKPFDTAPEADLQNLKKITEKVIDLVMANGPRIIFCTYPSLISYESFAKHPAIMLGTRRFHIYLSMDGMNDALIKGNAIVFDTSIEKNITIVDVSAAIPKTLEYFEDAYHYTDNGAALFAEKIATQILLDPESR